jgi:hypothetical protein
MKRTALLALLAQAAPRRRPQPAAARSRPAPTGTRSPAPSHTGGSSFHLLPQATLALWLAIPAKAPDVSIPLCWEQTVAGRWAARAAPQRRQRGPWRDGDLPPQLGRQLQLRAQNTWYVPRPDAEAAAVKQSFTES